MRFLIPIIVESQDDLNFISNIQSILNIFDIDSIVRVSSPHKSCTDLLNIINDYEKNSNVKTYITISSKSVEHNTFIDDNTLKPVFSYFCMPTGYDTATISAIKVLSLFDNTIIPRFKQYKQTLIIYNRVQDITNKYKNIIDNKIINKSTFDAISLLSDTDTNMKINKIQNISNKCDYLLLSFTDKFYALTQYITNIPYKAEVLHRINVWWYNQLNNLVPNHFIYSESSDKCIIRIKKCKPLPIKFLVYNYLTGYLWESYKNGVRTYCNYELPDGMVENQSLPHIFFTTTNMDYKFITKQDILLQNIMSKKLLQLSEDYSRKIFNLGQNISNQNGLILVNTKYEFGTNTYDNLMLVNELHTPDTSLFWLQHCYLERFKLNKKQYQFGKEYIVNWINSNYTIPHDGNIDISVTNKITNNFTFNYLCFYELITNTPPIITYEDESIITIEL